MKPRRDEKPEAVYRACRGRMYQAAYRILRDPAEAEDAVHEGFISMLPFLDRVDDPASPPDAGLCRRRGREPRHRHLPQALTRRAGAL